MADCRDWTSTLWPSSFKGVPFWVETDDEDGGRRLVVHEFPNRDLPFVEDLGEAVRRYSVTAYLASDMADVEAAALTAVCTMRGAGPLVLPIHGPVLVKCENFKRNRSKDRNGYIALSLSFVREGFNSAVASIPMLANLVFISVAALALVASRNLTRRVAIRASSDYVAASAVDDFRTAVASVEAVRVALPIEPKASAIARDALKALYRSVPDLFDRTAGVDVTAPSALFSTVLDLGSASPPEAAKVFLDLSDSAADPVRPLYLTPTTQVVYENAIAVQQVTRLAALAAYAEAIARTTFKSRQEGITVRGDIAERLELEMNRASGSEQHDLFLAIQDLRGRLIEYLSLMITDLAPVVTVAANRSMPSLWWAWRLYGDPSRSTDLVKRNRVAHPSFMPERFEALSR
jgi:prophage DNA circulation protein